MLHSNVVHPYSTEQVTQHYGVKNQTKLYESTNILVSAAQQIFMQSRSPFTTPLRQPFVHIWNLLSIWRNQKKKDLFNREPFIFIILIMILETISKCDESFYDHLLRHLKMSMMRLLILIMENFWKVRSTKKIFSSQKVNFPRRTLRYTVYHILVWTSWSCRFLTYS